MTAWSHLPQAFTGSWGDLNDIGSSTGSYPLGVGALIRWVLRPVGYAKFLAPLALFILGLGAWAFFRQLKLAPLAVTLGALATILNSAYFATACWGVAPQQIAIGMDFFALALAVSNTSETPALIRWTRLALAGLAVGINVMEAADIGAIFSLFIAAFVIYKVLIEDVVPLVGIERVIVLCCVNGAFLSLFVLGIVFGLGIFKLCLLLVFLLVAAFALIWSLMRKLIPLTKTEQIVALSLVNLAFLLLFICGIVHGFGFFPLALLLIVAIMLNWALLRYHLFVNRCGLGVIRLAVIAVFAGFIATQTVVTLIGTQIKGVVGTGQDTESKAQHWDWATQWSYPKIETLGLFVPGVFGYKYDTPKDMMEFLQNSYQGGVYWGLVGCDPSWDSYFANGEKGTPGQGILRFAGGQNYAGILVVLVALWAIAQSLRRQNSVFAGTQRRFIWFWAAVLAGSLLLAWGRFTPFDLYRHTIYALPYFSTIRNPAKFLCVFSFAVVTLFAYGMHALNRRYLEIPATGSASLSEKFKDWWRKAGRFDRNWTWGCLLAFVVSVLAWLIYAAGKPDLVRYLQKAGFPDEETAKQMAAFSVGQVSWFVLLFALAIGLCLLVLAGVFAGKRARLGGVLLGAFLVADLGRADLPYITHWDYKQKYASNPIIDFLRDKPYEHRVASLPFHAPQQFALFEELYRIEWMQHHFPYYNIQSLDIVQRPRLPADLEAYERALAPDGTPDSVYLIARHWQLTNTRYLLGPAGFLDVLNEQLDPLQHRFRIIQRFDITLKPGVEQFTKLEELTAVPTDNGPYALFDFTGALPRAKLYSHWQINTNDTATLQTLAGTNFDAWQTVLVSAPPPVMPAANTANENPGTVEYKGYAPKDLKLDVKANAPSVLLLNDKFDPHWRVLVDGKPAELLRCNFIMRGVFLAPGPHTVEFKFTLPPGPLYVTLTAIGVAALLCGCLII